MCRALNVSESGYHTWRQRPESGRKQELKTEIKAAHQRTIETYTSTCLSSSYCAAGSSFLAFCLSRDSARQTLNCSYYLRAASIGAVTVSSIVLPSNRLDTSLPPDL
jgi:hypothetical protein